MEKEALKMADGKFTRSSSVCKAYKEEKEIHEKEKIIDSSSESDYSSSQNSEGGVKRERWDRKVEFMLSLIGYSVAFGNIQRFPYLCVKNGGGAFLIPFFFFLLTCGVPLYYLEVCLGQFSGRSPIGVWKLCPLFEGLGILMVIISGICSWYYNTLVAWTLYFLGNSFKSPLPWAKCEEWWNTEECRRVVVFSNSTFNSTLQNSSTAMQKREIFGSVSPALEYWQRNVLRISGGLDDIGDVQWHLALSLFGAWVLVFLCLIKGVQSVGKVVYVTAILPYILFAVFFIRGVTLPGATDGILYYLTPDFNRLLNSQVWLEAAIQVFFSLGATWGGVITMASYNKFHDSCLKTSLIVSLTEGFSSFIFGFAVFATLGFMATELNTTVKDVAENGPGIIFVTYPEAIAKLPLPQLWAILFWLMMITVGLDTQFGMFETLCTGIVEVMPSLAKRKTLVVAVIAVVFFLTALPLTTNGGMYIYQLIDWYSAAFCLILCAFLETVIIAWIYGAERFSRDVMLMTGNAVPVVIRICWCIICPIALFTAFVFTLVRYEAPSYNKYTYPNFARAIGLLLAFIPIMPIPIVMAKQIYDAKGNVFERLRQTTKPAKNWLPQEEKYVELYKTQSPPNPQTLLEQIKINLLGTDFTHITDITNSSV